jgi:hypothetical protein
MLVGPKEVEIASGRVTATMSRETRGIASTRRSACHATLHRIGGRVKGCGMGTRGCNEVEFKLAIQVASGQSITTPGQPAFTRMSPWMG